MRGVTFVPVHGGRAFDCSFNLNLSIASCQKDGSKCTYSFRIGLIYVHTTSDSGLKLSDQEGRSSMYQTRDW